MKTASSFVDFLESGQTINGERYLNVLRELKQAFKKKRPGLDVTNITLHHDNAQPHTARITAEEIANLGWKIMPQPPYSPDLTPSDFHLCTYFVSYLDWKYCKVA